MGSMSQAPSAQETSMTCTLGVPLQIIAEVHEIDGCCCWAELPRFPGCVAQAETVERRDIRRRSTFVPPGHMAIVNSKTAVRAKVIGG